MQSKSCPVNTLIGNQVRNNRNNDLSGHLLEAASIPLLHQFRKKKGSVTQGNCLPDQPEFWASNSKSLWRKNPKWVALLNFRKTETGRLNPSGKRPHRLINPGNFTEYQPFDFLSRFSGESKRQDWENQSTVINAGWGLIKILFPVSATESSVMRLTKRLNLKTHDGNNCY